MTDNNLSIRPIQASDIPFISEYWLNSSEDHLVGMGVDLNKMPKKEDFEKMVLNQISLPIEEKKTYALIWLFEDKPIGHCNVNQIEFGEQAYMHLHLWQSKNRKKGIGTQLVKGSIKHFFEELKLKQLFCEPYAHNPAPNKTMEKLGFQFIKTHTTIPGSINFEQEVNLWRITKDQIVE